MKKLIILIIVFGSLLSLLEANDTKWIRLGSIELPLSACISNDGSYFGINTRADGLNIIDTKTGYLKSYFVNEGGFENGFAFSSDSKYIMYIDKNRYYNEEDNRFYDYYVWKIYNLESNLIEYEMDDLTIEGSYYSSIFTLPNNKFLFVNGKYDLAIWDLKSRSIIKSKKLNTYKISYIQPNYKLNEIITFSEELQKIIVFDTQNLTERISWKTPSPNAIKYFSVSDHGNYIAVYNPTGALFTYDIKLYSTNNGKLIKTIKNVKPGYYNTFNKIGFLDNDTKIVYPSNNGMVIESIIAMNERNIYDLYVGVPTLFFTNSVNNQIIQYNESSGIAVMVNGSNGQLIHNLNDSFRGAIDIKFSFDDQYIVSVENINSFQYLLFRVFSSETGQTLNSYYLYKNKTPYSSTWIEMSPKRYEMIYPDGDNNLNVVNYITGNVVASLSGHASKIIAGYYSKNGNLFISISSDNNLKIWDLNSYSVIHNYNHNKELVWATFLDNNDEVLIVQADETDIENRRELSLIIYDYTTNTIIRESNKEVIGFVNGELGHKNFALSSNSKLFAWWARMNSKIRPFKINVSDFTLHKPLIKPDYSIDYRLIYTFKFNPIYDYIVAQSLYYLHYIDYDGNVIKENITEFPELNPHVASYAISNNGKYIVSNIYYYMILYNAPQTSTSVQDDFLHTLNDINLYPNPATEQINIEIPNEEEFISIAMFNLLGELVWQSTNFAYSKNINIPVETLTSGMYILKLTTNKQTYSKYFVKHK